MIEHAEELNKEEINKYKALVQNNIDGIAYLVQFCLLEISNVHY